MAVKQINRENYYEEVKQTDQLVLIDFWADWCGPCRMMAPLVERLAETYPQIKVCKVNIDDEMELANTFHILSIPTLVMVQDGKMVGSSVGLQPENKLLRFVNQYLDK